jgi:uncharacterized membrane protein
MPDAALPPLTFEPDFCVVSRWRLSLPARSRWAVFGGLAAFSITLALAFVAAGAWVVLPYSVLELAVLACAFRFLERRAASWERLTVAGDRVVVERGSGGSEHARREWNRPWVRVEMGAPRSGGDARLYVCCGGERWEFGHALPARERGDVARALRRLTAAPGYARNGGTSSGKAWA